MWASPSILLFGLFWSASDEFVPPEIFRGDKIGNFSLNQTNSFFLVFFSLVAFLFFIFLPGVGCDNA